jgi:hypothetical protein
VPVKSGRAVLPRRVLTQLAGAAETGALYVEGEPGGTLYLAGGLVSYAESPAAPDAGELLTVSGRVPPHVWHAVLAGTPGTGAGAQLVAQGHLTQGELELCLLGALYDAAFFVLSPTPARVRFEPGGTHPLGGVCRVDPAVLGREVTRRRRQLDEAYPGSAVDSAPITPVLRAPVPRLALTATQWELVVHADGKRTAADLARLLGRAGYNTLLELRRLAAAGLVTVDGDDGPVGAEPPPPPPLPALPAPESNSNGNGRSAPRKAGIARKPASPARRTQKNRATEGELPQRSPGAELPPVEAAVAAHEPDVPLLKRIRSGLKALR